MENELSPQIIMSFNSKRNKMQTKHLCSFCGTDTKGVKMHFIVIKFVLICLYLMVPLRTKVTFFFLGTIGTAIEIY